MKEQINPATTEQTTPPVREAALSLQQVAANQTKGDFVMKKLFALILAGIMSLSLVACGGNDAPAKEEAPADDAAVEETASAEA